LAKQKKIAVTGASGLIGSALCAQLKSDGHQVIKIVRRAARVPDEVSWNPLKGEIDIAALEGTDAVFHLAGAGVGDKRWSAAYRSEILNSRLLGTTTIANACEQIQPEVFI
jgi:NAD dependent epimerase/dehydratase family enzyme